MRWGELVRAWGVTEGERVRRFPCDDVLPEYDEAWYRGVTVRAEPATVFRWLCQLRVAPYSYDWIDNFGRPSPAEWTPGLETLEPGQRFMRIFDLAAFERDAHVTLRLRRPSPFPPLAVSYVVDGSGADGTRLLVKLVLRLGRSPRSWAARHLGPWLDWIMMRRQLLNLKALAERARTRDPRSG